MSEREGLLSTRSFVDGVVAMRVVCKHNNNNNCLLVVEKNAKREKLWIAFRLFSYAFLRWHDRLFEFELVESYEPSYLVSFW